MSLRAAVCCSALLLAACATPGGWASPTPLEAAARCDACGRRLEVGGDGVAWPDGRASCGRCRALAVLDPQAGLQVLGDARRALRDELGLDLGEVAVGLRLVDRARLQAGAGEGLAHPDLRAYTEVFEVLKGEAVEARRFTVLALLGTPRSDLLGILAHELFHVWQVLRGGVRPQADPAFREGAAQYAQLRVARARGIERAVARLLRDPDPVYGEGLRRFQRLAEARGAAEALQLGATSDRFPAGY